MRKAPLVNDLYYHIYNRGVDKRDIFKNKRDIDRFLFSMEFFQYEEAVGSVRDLKRNLADVRRLQKGQKLVSIVEYCLNPNHFHFILKQEVDGGISEFMKRLSGGYTKYFNEKYKRSGALFQGKFKSSLIETDNYLNLLLAYVMWNYRVHDIPKSKINLIKSSEDEYVTGRFEIVDRKEAEYFIGMFGGFSNFKNNANEMINFVREGRGKEVFEYQD